MYSVRTTFSGLTPTDELGSAVRAWCEAIGSGTPWHHTGQWNIRVDRSPNDEGVTSTHVALRIPGRDMDALGIHQNSHSSVREAFLSLAVILHSGPEVLPAAS